MSLLLAGGGGGGEGSVARWPGALTPDQERRVGTVLGSWAFFQGRAGTGPLHSRSRPPEGCCCRPHPPRELLRVRQRPGLPGTGSQEHAPLEPRTSAFGCLGCICHSSGSLSTAHDAPLPHHGLSALCRQGPPSALPPIHPWHPVPCGTLSSTANTCLEEGANVTKKMRWKLTYHFKFECR